MAYREGVVSMPSTIRRVYSAFRGVDFSSDPSKVESYRSPYGVNVYKDYASGNGQAIETFPGYKKLADFDDQIYGIHAIHKPGDPTVYTQQAAVLDTGMDIATAGGHHISTMTQDATVMVVGGHPTSFAAGKHAICILTFTEGVYVPGLFSTENYDNVVRVAVSDNGELIAVIGLVSGSVPVLAVYDNVNGNPALRWSRALDVTDSVRMTISPDGRYIFVGGNDRFEGCWLILQDASSSVLYTQHGTSEMNPVGGLAYHNGLLITMHPIDLGIIDSTTIKGWSMADGVLTRNTLFDVIVEGPTAISFSHEGRYLSVSHSNETFNGETIYEIRISGFTPFGTIEDRAFDALGYFHVWTKDAENFVVATSNVITVYQRSGSSFTKLRDLSTTLYSQVYSIDYGVLPSGERIFISAGDTTGATVGNPLYLSWRWEAGVLTRVLVHAGEYLYRWVNYPHSNTGKLDVRGLTVVMNNARSRLTAFDGKYYINDGKNYLIYDWDTDTAVAVRYSDPYVPYTHAGISVDGATETSLQPENALTSLRKNTFVCNGVKTIFQLIASNDTTPVDANSVTVWFRYGVVTTGFTVDYTAHTVTFATAPIAPATPGEPELMIRFGQTTSIHDWVIEKCNIVAVYDNRLFFSGNPDAPNQYYHCQANDASYIPANAYYTAGTTSAPITGMALVGSGLTLYKSADQLDATVFIINETTTTDELQPKAYPALSSLAGVGCVAPFGYLNFRDDPVFISKYGLEAIAKMDFSSERIIEHRSTMIDGKFVNEPNLKDAMVIEWRGYLCCLINGRIYLADSRQAYRNSITKAIEYEWYYLDTVGGWTGGIIQVDGSRAGGNFYLATTLCVIDDQLYFGTEAGQIYRYNHNMAVEGALPGSAYNNDGRIIFSCWALPYDDCGQPNRFKRTNRRGAKVDLKTLTAGIIKIRTRTERSSYEEIADLIRQNTGALDWGFIDFSDFTFNTWDVSTAYFKPREKKFEKIACLFYSDEYNRPFGLLSAIYEVYVTGYSKAETGG